MGIILINDSDLTCADQTMACYSFRMRVRPTSAIWKHQADKLRIFLPLTLPELPSYLFARHSKHQRIIGVLRNRVLQIDIYLLTYSV